MGGLQFWLTWMILCITQLPTLSTSNPKIDPKGYITYCPCMGRFGNQADQFLGSLAFAKALDRTLVLPPWVEHRPESRKATMIPFDTYFKVESLEGYHRVIPMETFMRELAPIVWPPGDRKVFCYAARHNQVEQNGCDAKNGNPFGPFWDSFNVDFDSSVIFGPLFFETNSNARMAEWKKKYPAKEFPVLAFVGPPGSFPVSEFNVKLQKYIQWSDEYEKMADDFISENMQQLPFLAIHLRNGPDFKQACQHISSSPSIFASAQCIGYRSQHGTTTHQMCFPSVDTVTQQVKKTMEERKLKVLFIGTDYEDWVEDFQRFLDKSVKIVKQPTPASPMLDLAVMGKADHFTGNCVSTFSAFVKRERDCRRLTTSFWAFDKKQKKKKTEL